MTTVAVPPLPSATSSSGKYATAAARWAGVGPYYAMFPASFADDVIEKYTRPGDLVCDPFAGRGTALFSAATRGRRAVGTEINPVGWIYSRAKLAGAPLEKVLARFLEVGCLADQYRKAAAIMPEFFQFAFSPAVLAFLLAARAELGWRQSATDATTMAILLIDLHGKRSAALSNQMRQTKSMWPEYAVRWWRDHRMTVPPEREPATFLSKKALWRYAKGRPEITSGSRVLLGDSTQRLGPLLREESTPVQLLFTSPPYLGVTHYYNDQWLRLWMLGGPSRPPGQSEKPNRGRFCNQPAYRRMLEVVFTQVARCMDPSGVIYVRTDRREETRTVTIDVLRSAFKDWRLVETQRPVLSTTQTRLFGNKESGAGEVDLLLTADSQKHRRRSRDTNRDAKLPKKTTHCATEC